MMKRQMNILEEIKRYQEKEKLINQFIEKNFLNDRETAVELSEEYCNKINSLIYKIIKKKNTDDTIKLVSRTLVPNKNIDTIVQELELLFYVLKKTGKTQNLYMKLQNYIS